jgi:NADH-quinone oxidoreductase subunit N
VLCIGASILLIAGLARQQSMSELLFAVALTTIAIAVYATYRQWDTTGATPSLLSDSIVWYTRMVTMVVGLLILLVNRHVPEASNRGEFFGLMLFSLAGVLLVSVANDLVLLFLALELVSVPTYILVGLSRRDVRAQEATGKYFFLGAFAAALMLYGFSFLYGAAGTMRLFDTGDGGASIGAVLGRTGALADPLVVVGLLLALAGLAFKIAAVPLHFYVADVYQGAASPVTGMLGFVPKFAGLLAIVRLLSLCNWNYDSAVFWLLWALAAATMTVGNTLALWQNNVKRMLAYSSVAHSGYLLVAIVAGPGNTNSASPMRNGLSAMLFYILVYGVMNLGAFAALSLLRKEGEEGEDSAETLSDIAGAGRRQPWAGLALAVCVLSLMGLPPTGGFVGKIYVFSAALFAAEGTARHTAMVVLVVIGVLNSAIAAAYYLRIISACFVRSPAEGIRLSTCYALQTALFACAVIVLTLFVWPEAVFDKAHAAAGHSISADRTAFRADAALPER